MLISGSTVNSSVHRPYDCRAMNALISAVMLPLTIFPRPEVVPVELGTSDGPAKSVKRTGMMSTFLCPVVQVARVVYAPALTAKKSSRRSTAAGRRREVSSFMLVWLVRNRKPYGAGRGRTGVTR